MKVMKNGERVKIGIINAIEELLVEHRSYEFMAPTLKKYNINPLYCRESLEALTIIEQEKLLNELMAMR